MKTAIFLIAFWSVFPLAIPIGISIIEVQLGIQRFPSQSLFAVPLLLGSTLLMAWAAMTLAIKGRGTPLPFDPPREFVSNGPYAYIRHPFVTGALGQIVAVGLAFGSVPVLVYAALAITVWYYGIRPGEERALDQRFGSRVQDYRRQVRGFRPF